MIRIHAVVADATMAGNVGGPVHVFPKSFDVECPALEKLLAEHNGKGYTQASVTGVEVVAEQIERGERK